MRVAARSDAGLVREVNEDYVFVDPALGLVIVADGQGGLVTGVLAARLAVESLRQALEEAGRVGNPEQRIREALVAIDRVIFDAAKSEGQTIDAAIVARLDEHAKSVLEMARARRGTLRDMHAALAIAKADDDEFVVAQVGRCRIYRISSGAAMPIFAMQPRCLAAANAVGTGNVAPDVLRVRLHRDERLLLCSDGLHDVVNDDTLAASAAGASLDDAVDALIEHARFSSNDNIALAILEVEGEAFASWRNALPYQTR